MMRVEKGAFLAEYCYIFRRNSALAAAKCRRTVEKTSRGMLHCRINNCGLM